MNAVNFIDGLDGLVAGVCLIANGVFFAYSYMLVRDTGASNYFNLASFIAAVLIGACIGFLPLNWSPAKLFMGDCRRAHARPADGHLRDRDHRPSRPRDRRRQRRVRPLPAAGAFIPILLPVVVVLLPLLDFGLAVIRRMRAGQVAVLARPQAPAPPDAGHGALATATPC